jgi:hypothetical protein
LIALYCAHGREVSQTAAAALRALGFNAVYLEGGFEDWVRIGLPTRRNVGGVSGKWVTRERPKIDRIACPWLIRRFIDPYAQFLYVPTAMVIATANQLNATPYDIDGVKFAHEGEPMPARQDYRSEGPQAVRRDFRHRDDFRLLAPMSPLHASQNA